MSYSLNRPAQQRLNQFLAGIGRVLRHSAQRANFALYAMGLLGEGERKSVEPIAARACGNQVDKVDAMHQRLLHFIGPAKWSDQTVRLEATRYALAAMTLRGPVGYPYRQSTIPDFDLHRRDKRLHQCERASANRKIGK